MQHSSLIAPALARLAVVRGLVHVQKARCCWQGIETKPNTYVTGSYQIQTHWSNETA